MYCGMVEAAQKALLETVVCTEIYATAENTGSQSTEAPIRTIKTHLFHKLYIFINMLA